MLSRYRNILGRPRQGAHALRIPVVDVALVDVILTGFAVKALVDHSRLNVLQSTSVLIVAGIVTHQLFSVDAVWLK